MLLHLSGGGDTWADKKTSTELMLDQLLKPTIILYQNLDSLLEMMALTPSKR